MNNIFNKLTKCKISDFEFGFIVTKYKYSGDTIDAQIINTYNTNGIFKHEDFFDWVHIKTLIKQGFLEPAINFRNILYEDYKILNKEEILNYVWDNFSPFSERQIEKEKILFNQFKIILNDQPTDKYYLLDMKFFDLTYDKDLNMASDKITSYDAICYELYFVVKWFEEENILNVALFSYD